MPYIKQENRKEYTETLDDLCFVLDEHGWVPGEVTYVLYMIVARWFRKMPSYITIAQIRGVLIGTMTEFDRRVAAPYEDEKIKENGDVEIESLHMDGGEWEIEPGFDESECDCGRELLGVHLRGEHNGNS